MKLKEKYGEWALITGASSGIGEEFARQLAHQKINIVLVARRKNRLDALASELHSKNGIKVIAIPLDLSQSDFLRTVEKSTSSIKIGLLINNAGFTISAAFLDSDLLKQKDLIAVNMTALTVLTHLFGNKMKANQRGAIINVASGSAFLPVPKWATYAASKAFVLHFTEALWYELKDYNVDVLALCPAATKTEFGQNLYSQSGMEVSEVVSTALKNLSKRPSVICGSKNKLGVALLKLFNRKALIAIGAKVLKTG